MVSGFLGEISRSSTHALNMKAATATPNINSFFFIRISSNFFQPNSLEGQVNAKHIDLGTGIKVVIHPAVYFRIQPLIIGYGPYILSGKTHVSTQTIGNVLNIVAHAQVVQLKERGIFHKVITGKLTLHKLGVVQEAREIFPITDLIHLVVGRTRSHHIVDVVADAGSAGSRQVKILITVSQREAQQIIEGRILENVLVLIVSRNSSSFTRKVGIQTFYRHSGDTVVNLLIDKERFGRMTYGSNLVLTSHGIAFQNPDKIRIIGHQQLGYLILVVGKVKAQLQGHVAGRKRNQIQSHFHTLVLQASHVGQQTIGKVTSCGNGNGVQQVGGFAAIQINRT